MPNGPHLSFFHFLELTHSHLQVALTPVGSSVHFPHSGSVGNSSFCSSGATGVDGDSYLLVLMNIYSTPSPSLPLTPHFDQIKGADQSPQWPLGSKDVPALFFLTQATST